MIVRAAEFLRVPPQPIGGIVGKVDEVDRHDAACQLKCSFDGFRDALLSLRPDDGTVDDHLDVMLAFLVNRGQVGELVTLAIDAHTRVSVAEELPEQLGEFAFPPTHHGGENLEAGAFVECHEAIDDLLRGLLPDGRTALGAVRYADPCVQQTQVVVDFCDGADGGARVPARRFLIDRYCRRKALDEVHVGLVHLAQEHTRVRGQRLYVSSLPFGENRVERE